MQDAIEKCKRELLAAIRDSEEYREFEKNKRRLASHPELRSQVDDFRKRIYLLQNSEESVDVMEEMNRMSKERSQLYKNSLAASYLLSELSICRILQQIAMDVLTVTDIEIDGFEDVISI